LSKPECPECKSTKLVSWGFRWKCKDCGRQFMKKYRKKKPQPILTKKDLSKLYTGTPLNKNQRLIEGKEL